MKKYIIENGRQTIEYLGSIVAISWYGQLSAIINTQGIPAPRVFQAIEAGKFNTIGLRRSRGW